MSSSPYGMGSGTSGQVLEEIDVQEELEPEKLWNVVVMNDPVNLMAYVIMVFRKVFGMSGEKAKEHMLEVHNLGRSIVWTGQREKAENYAYTLHQWQLNAVIEENDA